MSLHGESFMWSQEHVTRALETLLVSANLGVEAGVILPIPIGGHQRSFMNRKELAWFVDGPRAVGIEGVASFVPGRDLQEVLSAQRAVLVAVSKAGQDFQYVAAVIDRASCRLLTPTGTEVQCATSELASYLNSNASSVDVSVAALLDGVPGGRAAAKRFCKRDSGEGITTSIFSYRRDSASPFWLHFNAANGHRKVLALAVLMLVNLAILGGAAFTLGSAALDGIIDAGRVLAWTLASIAGVPLVYWMGLLAGDLSLITARIVRTRALEGSFFIDEAVLRRQGYGAALARLSETSVVERVGAMHLFGFTTPFVALVAAVVLFSKSTSAILFLTLVCGFVAALVVLSWRLVKSHVANYGLRLDLTEDVVDKVIGHRTRAIQQHPSMRHGREDQSLVRYTDTMRSLDRYGLLVRALQPAWTVAALSIVLMLFVQGADFKDLLVPIGGVFLFGNALGSFAGMTTEAASLYTAWSAVAPLLRAGTQRERARREEVSEIATEYLPTVLAASSVSFSYRPGGRAVLSEASTRILRGERVLLEGTSGGGKSTFVKLVAGELQPTGGTVLVDGLDSSTTSQADWRDLVASAPQFHENHIFSNTFAFNVDPRAGGSEMSAEALQVCTELGLAEVLARMPSSYTQMLGETGWQLSHGERSRIFVARALLQRSRLLIFDESFAALDPITLASVMACVRRRAPTLVVIAHT